VGKIVGIILSFAKSSLCLVRFSLDGQDRPALQEVDGEVGSPLVDDACIPIDIDMTLLSMRLIKTSSTTFSVVHNSSNIHAQG
jgi:hypothetical protein